jgi:hypothetical protein
VSSHKMRDFCLQPNMRRALLYICLLCCFVHYKSQGQIATPQIINYNNDQYKAGIQNWDLAQDKNGILYFGNNEGLLTFNGKFWNLIRLPNLTSVRSVEIDSKNRIFVGGQDEAGYFSRVKTAFWNTTPLSL